MIKNRNLDMDARWRLSNWAHFDLSTAATAPSQKNLVLHPNCRIRVKKVHFSVNADLDGAEAFTLGIGTTSDTNLFYDTIPTTSTSAFTSVTVDSDAPTTDVVAGTPVVATLSSSACTNTGEVEVAVTYEIQDRATA